jgi:DNA-binding NarL/FixJ family response regulator
VRSVLAHGAGAVAVVAPPGGGVSTVLDAVDTEATDDFGRRVLRAAGRPAEAESSWAVLRELAARDETGELAEALRTIGADRDVSTVVFEWAGEAASVAVMVDDLHHADTPSAAAIAHLARRAELTTVVVVIGSHDAEGLDGIETVVLPGLTVDELMSVIEQRVGSIDGSVGRRIAELAEGSPLVAVEVARSLDDRQRRGDEPLPSFAAVAAPVRHAFTQAVDALPESTRRSLCLAAAEPTGELRVIVAALTELGESVEALEAAEEVGVVEIVDGEVRFDHPIRRSVAYHQLAPASRRAAHRALAGALDAPADAERRAAHLATGVIEPDARIAADLELVAEAAERRRDRLEARRWWLAAARLSPTSDDAARRTQRADAVMSGDDDPLAGLTKAERRVAAVVGTGASNKAAAERLYVSVKTVDAHLQSIYRKLAISSRAELAVLVTHAGLTGAPAAG